MVAHCGGFRLVILFRSSYRIAQGRVCLRLDLGRTVLPSRAVVMYGVSQTITEEGVESSTTGFAEPREEVFGWSRKAMAPRLWTRAYSTVGSVPGPPALLDDVAAVGDSKAKHGPTG
jgi:hypothetical protein